jgi:GAF domain-containing protein
MESVASLLALLSEGGQPAAIYRAVEAASQQSVGHGLFTLLIVDGTDVARVYSSRPEQYPVSGRKTMGPTPWGDLVLKRMTPWVGRDKAAIRWAFSDHALIESMGLGSVINLPIVYDGHAIGTMNLLAPEQHYHDAHLALVAPLAPLLVPAFLAARHHAAIQSSPRT